VDFLKSIGIDNASQEAWGEFGKGWELEKAYFAMTAPYYKPILAYPKTWTAGTKGLKHAEVLVVDMKDSLSLLNYKGKLKNKVILPDMSYAYNQSFKADAVRYSEEDLQKMAAASAPGGGRQQRDTAQMRRMREQMQRNMAPQRLLTILKNMAKEEGAIAILSSSTRNHDGTIFAQGGGTYKATDPDNFLDMVLGVEDYNTLLRISKSGVNVGVDADVKTTFYKDDLNGYNVDRRNSRYRSRFERRGGDDWSSPRFVADGYWCNRQCFRFICNARGHAHSKISQRATKKNHSHWIVERRRARFTWFQGLRGKNVWWKCYQS